jgi:hypothetical protein
MGSLDPPRRASAGVKADFDGSTPQDVVLGAIASATGHLSVTR